MSTTLLIGPSLPFSETGCEQYLLPNRVPKWYAAFTMPRHEKRLARHCQERGIEFFLPLYSTRRRWKNRHTATVESPLFPNYIFVRIDQMERARVLKLPGVLSIVSSGRRPLPIPDDYIKALQGGLFAYSVKPHPNVDAGDRVVITKGPMTGMEGVVERQKNRVRVIVRLELIGRSLAVEVGATEVSNIITPLNHWNN